MEYHLVESMELAANSIVRDALQVSGATQIEAQSNMPRMLEVLERWGAEIIEEKILFEDFAAPALRVGRSETVLPPSSQRPVVNG